MDEQKKEVINSAEPNEKQMQQERLDNLFYAAGKLLIYEGDLTPRHLMNTLLIGHERASKLLEQLRKYGLYKKEGEETQILLTIDEFDELYEKLQQEQFNEFEDE